MHSLKAPQNIFFFLFSLSYRDPDKRSGNKRKDAKDGKSNLNTKKTRRHGTAVTADTVDINTRKGQNERTKGKDKTPGQKPQGKWKEAAENIPVPRPRISTECRSP